MSVNKKEKIRKRIFGRTMKVRMAMCRRKNRYRNKNKNEKGRERKISTRRKKKNWIGKKMWKKGKQK